MSINWKATISCGLQTAASAVILFVLGRDPMFDWYITTLHGTLIQIPFMIYCVYLSFRHGSAAIGGALMISLSLFAVFLVSHLTYYW